MLIISIEHISFSNTKGLSQSLPEGFVLEILLVRLTEVKVSHLDGESVPVVGAEGDPGDDDDHDENAADDGDDDDAYGTLTGHVVHRNRDNLDMAGDLVCDHHEEVIGVAVAEIPDYGELALALEERWGIGGVTSLITCHNKS